MEPTIPGIQLEITSKTKALKLDGEIQYAATARFTWIGSDTEPVNGMFVLPQDAWNTIEVGERLTFAYYQTEEA